MTTLAIPPCVCGGSALMATTIHPGSILEVERVAHVPALSRPDPIQRAWQAVEAKREMRHG